MELTERDVKLGVGIVAAAASRHYFKQRKLWPWRVRSRTLTSQPAHHLHTRVDRCTQHQRRGLWHRPSPRPPHHHPVPSLPPALAIKSPRSALHPTPCLHPYLNVCPPFLTDIHAGGVAGAGPGGDGHRHRLGRAQGAGPQEGGPGKETIPRPPTLAFRPSHGCLLTSGVCTLSNVAVPPVLCTTPLAQSDVRPASCHPRACGASSRELVS